VLWWTSTGEVQIPMNGGKWPGKYSRVCPKLGEAAKEKREKREREKKEKEMKRARKRSRIEVLFLLLKYTTSNCSGEEVSRCGEE
jgi:hypothetical protein